jgi:hypothetical protein
MLTVCFGHASGLVKQHKNGLSCLIELTAPLGAALLAAG